jgi:SPP1 gp7 family putative phage head morphogenesis protein
MNDPNILLDAFKLKPAAAIEYMKRKGYGFSWNWYDMWKDAHAKAFTVAKVTKVEVMRDIRAMVQKALDEGMTWQQFKKELTPQLQKRGWWGKKEHIDKETGEVTEYMAGSPRRLRTIFETNHATAYVAGRYKGQMDAAEDLPYLQYIAMTDGKTTDSCRDLHGRIFRADDPIWDYMYPPNHWGCRSRVRSLTENQIKRMGIEPESSKGRIVEKEVIIGKGDKARKEKITGLVLGKNKVHWIGPGWDYNPGKEAWMPNLSIYHTNDARAFIRDGLKGPYCKHFLEAKGGIGGAIPVAAMPKKYMKAVGAKTDVVWLSADSLWKNAAHHPEITTSDYQRLQTVIENATIVLQDPKSQNKAHFLDVGDKSYLAVVKATQDGARSYVVSFRNIGIQKIDKLMARWKVIKK